MAVSPASCARHRVVIVGGGFGGLRAAKRLAGVDADVTLVDRRNHHLFQPLLYQVATAGLNPADIADPIRRILRDQTNVEVLLAEAVRVRADDRVLELDAGELRYDTLVLATGARHSYFGHDEWEADAPGLKSVEDALEIRRRILSAFERAERATDPAERRRLLTFVVVGGGPTGVELAGAIAEIAFRSLSRDFRRIDPTNADVILLEGLDRILSTYPPSLSASARAQLSALRVDVRTGTLVTGVDGGGVDTSGGRIDAATVLWAAGVAASPLAATIGCQLDRSGRVLVEPDMSVPDHPEILVIGDLAAAGTDGEAVPGVAPAALQGGNHAAAVIRADLEGRPRPAFRYHDKGSLATIGRSAAVADFGRVRFGGFAAWVLWWAIHIAFLIDFRSRLAVMWGWAWQYVTFQHGARLITGRWRPGRS